MIVNFHCTSGRNEITYGINFSSLAFEIMEIDMIE
jgi:hypothetical protein